MALTPRPRRGAFGGLEIWLLHARFGSGCLLSSYEVGCGLTVVLVAMGRRSCAGTMGILVDENSVLVDENGVNARVHSSLTLYRICTGA